MSNYLNNLVARQLHRASLVEPRVPSLFEPPTQGSALPHERRSAREPLAVEVVEAETGVGVRPEIRDSIETPSGSPASRFHSPSDEAAHTIWRGRQQITSSSWPSAESTLDQTGDASTQVAAPQLQTATPPPTMTHPTAAPEEAAAQQQERNVRTPSPQHGAATEGQDKANEQTVSPRLKQSKIDAAPVDSTKDGVESTKNSVVVQPRVVLLVENRREASDFSLHTQPPTPEPPPVINVTIGRIEVRATAPAAAPPHRQLSAKPLMSLDEYLRRRTKGGGGG